MADDLSKLPFTFLLSRATLRNIKENIWFSNGINFIAMLLIIPGGAASLLFLALADVLAAVLVVLNAMILLKIN